VTCAVLGGKRRVLDRKGLADLGASQADGPCPKIDSRVLQCPPVTSLMTSSVRLRFLGHHDICRFLGPFIIFLFLFWECLLIVNLSKRSNFFDKYERHPDLRY